MKPPSPLATTAPEISPPTPHTCVSRPSPDSPAIKVWSSETLFAGAHEIEIDHGGTRYRLRKTSLGKLIMTK